MKLRYLNIDFFFKALNRPYYNSREFTKFARDYFADKELIGVEIGVNKGENAKNMFQMLNIKMLYLIDPYLEYDTYGSNANRLYNALINTNKFAKKRKLITRISTLAIYEINEELDFVYIDGNHNYLFAMDDIELYWEKVKVGGILGGHDFSPNCPGVAEAVIEFAKKNNLPIYHNNSIDWWFVKT